MAKKTTPWKIVALIALLILALAVMMLVKSPTVTLALKFTEGDSTNYRVVTEAKRSIEFQGPMPQDTEFTGGQTSRKLEMTFTQKIKNIDPNGNATAQITIKDLKYLSIIKDKTELDFDSSAQNNPNDSLSKLVGQSYTIEISPAGQMLKIVDISRAQAALKKTDENYRTAATLLSPEVIGQRHSISAIPPADKNQLRIGDSFSSVKEFSFDMMGTKSYERIYRLQQVTGTDNRKIAIIEVNAIPTTKKSEEPLEREKLSNLAKMFDNKATYTGKLNLNLTTGKVEKYVEELNSQWFTAKQLKNEDEEPMSLTMTAVRYHSLEQLNYK